jgi:hypothetical protein
MGENSFLLVHGFLMPLLTGEAVAKGRAGKFLRAVAFHEIAETP